MKKVRCPQCGKTTSWEGNPYRPFCSERCKLIDLGHWLAEDYSLEVPPEGVEEIHDLLEGTKRPLVAKVTEKAGGES